MSSRISRGAFQILEQTNVLTGFAFSVSLIAFEIIKNESLKYAFLGVG
jgi:hypothetical protein